MLAIRADGYLSTNPKTSSPRHCLVHCPSRKFGRERPQRPGGLGRSKCGSCRSARLALASHPEWWLVRPRPARDAGTAIGLPHAPLHCPFSVQLAWCGSGSSEPFPLTESRAFAGGILTCPLSTHVATSAPTQAPCLQASMQRPRLALCSIVRLPRIDVTLE